MSILGDIGVCKKKEAAKMADNVPDLYPTESLSSSLCNIPGRQDNYPAAHSRFRVISRLAIGVKESVRIIHPFPVVKEMHARAHE